MEGVDAWNGWREEHSNTWPILDSAHLERAHLEDANFAGAHLVGACLDGAHLERSHLGGAYLARAHLVGANLADANLDGANLVGAHLEGANLARAHLERANLARAHLDGAHLEGANLEGANLEGAHLEHTFLHGAYLEGAHLADAHLADAHLGGAFLYRTGFADVDLRQVKGLVAVKHHGPSPISTSTLERSHGQVPERFLRGCGLSDWQIENAKLFNPDLDEDERTTIWYEIERIRGQQPWAFSRVFISYTRNEDEAGLSDVPFVEALEKRFDAKGVRYWRDVHDMKAGRVDRQIDRAITLHPLVLVVLSERSVHSPWIEWEVTKAAEIRRELLERGEESRDVLCPVALDDAWERCDWPAPLRRQVENHHILDFSAWESDSAKMEGQFTRLYEGLVLNYRKKSGA